jgi:prophage DNA circulation protein
MAWSESLLDCSFRGVVFEVIKTNDGAERATAEHAYPYVDGASVEDLGRGPRSVSLEAFFYGQDYEQRLKTLLVKLDEPGAGELIHPVFGSMLVQLKRHHVSHDEQDVDQARVSLDFVETFGAEKPFFSTDLPTLKVDAVRSVAGRVRSALATAIESVINQLRASDALASFNAARAAMFNPLLATLADIHGVLLSGLDVLAYPRAWANDLSSVVDGVLDLRDFSTTLMADWKVASKVFGLLDVFSGSSGLALVSAGVSQQPTGLASIAPAVTLASIPSAIQPGIVASGTPVSATVFDAGVGGTAIGAQVRLTLAESQAVAAIQAAIAVAVAVGVAQATGLVLATEADPKYGPTLSPPDIEALVATARTRIEIAVVAARVILPLEMARAISEPLKDLALAVQEAARAVIEARPPLIRRVVPIDGNLRMLAHVWYGDHARAVELARLNPGLRIPNNLKPGDVIRAYSR